MSVWNPMRQEFERGPDAMPDSVDVHLVRGDEILKLWTVPVWREPDDSYEVDGKRYEVTGFSKHVQENGRTLYQIACRPAASNDESAPT